MEGIPNAKRDLFKNFDQRRRSRSNLSLENYQSREESKGPLAASLNLKKFNKALKYKLDLQNAVTYVEDISQDNSKEVKTLLQLNIATPDQGIRNAAS